MNTTDKYVTIYRRATGKTPEEGNLDDVRVGDTVTYRDEKGASASSRIAKVNIKAGQFRTEPQMYEQYVLRPAKSLKFVQIQILTRLNPYFGDNPAPELMIMEMFQPEVAPIEVPQAKRRKKSK